MHIAPGHATELAPRQRTPAPVDHPIELLARAYGIGSDDSHAMTNRHAITAADSCRRADYAAAARASAGGHGRAEAQPPRRGRPDLTFYFENYDTMRLQVQEMLLIEKGGDAQVPDELAAYNPLVPQGGTGGDLHDRDR